MQSSKTWPMLRLSNTGSGDDDDDDDTNINMTDDSSTS